LPGIPPRNKIALSFSLKLPKERLVKKALFLILAFMVVRTHAFADTSNGADPAERGFYFGLGTGAELPGSNWNPDYMVGGGANVFGGTALDKNWAGQLNLEEWFFTGGGTSLFNFRLLAEIKFTFEGKGFQPYLLAGPGIVFQTLSPTGDTTSNFDALAGLGGQWDLGGRAHLFLEAKYNFIISETTTFTDIPVNAGLWVGF